MFRVFHNKALEFRRKEDGAATYFACFMIMMMLLVGGIGLDLMANEMERVKRQNALDTAVLAAANLNQTEAAQVVFDDYMAKSGFADTTQNVTIVDAPGIRNVYAEINTQTDTQFLNLVGADALPLRASSRAQQILQGLEVSLVLDVSSSMASSNRLASMKPAAQAFVDIILSGETADAATINLIPYGGAVNLGDTMFNHLGGVRLADMPGAPQDYIDMDALTPNDDRACFDLNETDLQTSSLPHLGSYQQLARFGYWNSPITNPWCPQATSRVRYAANDPYLLKNSIDNMTLSDGTGTQHAMHTALALLDPSSQDDFEALYFAGDLDSDHYNRPLPYGSAKKYIVLMTDGGIASEFRPYDPYDPALETQKLRYEPNVYRARHSGDNREDFLEVCDRAKEPHREIVIFTVAMESSTAEELMQQCASSPAHFFKVDDGDIEDAFVLIANAVGRDALGLLN